MDQTTDLMRLDRTLRAAQAVLRDHLVSDPTSDRQALQRLREILEDEDFLRFQRATEGLGDEPRG